MGDMADYYARRGELDDPSFESEWIDPGMPVEHEVRPTVWVTKDKQEVRIADMTDSHLTNTIKMLWRTAPARHAQLTGEAYAFACTLQGECAIDAADDMIDHLEDMSPQEYLAETVPQWKYLLRQARKRKLPIAKEPWFESARADAEGV